jgi:hypothetical protein
MNWIVAALWLGLSLGFLLGWMTRVLLEKAQKRAQRTIRDLHIITSPHVPKDHILLVDQQVLERFRLKVRGPPS